MSIRLELFTLGGFETRLGGTPITGFRSRKVAALLAYLAANPQPQPREALAELLWRERSQAQSLSNLRTALSDLRKSLGDYLDICREKIGLDREADLWIDLDEFEASLREGRLEKAAELYRGDFLQGFYAPDAREFENWVAIEREKYRQKILLALQRLISTCRQQGEYPTALSFAQRLVELDKTSDVGHLELLRLLALTGQRGAVLARYAAYQSLLKEELGIEPIPEIAALVSRLQSGDWEAGIDPVASKPANPFAASGILEEKPLHNITAKDAFVGRERELAFLEDRLRQALGKQGNTVFISGEAGSGKTSLLGEFARRALHAHPDLIAALGVCTVFSGTGDPFLPFRELLAQLAGDLEGQLSAGTISSEQARRLWGFRKRARQAILEHGPDLIGSFLPARILSDLFKENGFARQKEQHISPGRKTDQQDHASLLSPNFMQQYADLLVHIAGQRPLLLLLEDLHWSDPSTASLLSYLSRRIIASPILILGTYRSEETLGETHPFGSALSEFARQFGEMRIDLNSSSEAENERFVAALIDSQPNHLGEDFRLRFSRHTGGHALFAVELLRDLQERGLLAKDAQGCWVEAERLAWDVLPARVEAIIERRVRRLDDEMCSVFKVASLEGEEFTAEIIAHALGLDAFILVRRLSDELAKESRWIEERSIGSAGSRRLSRYRFRHGLFQRYFFNHIGDAERAYLHERVGLSQENLYRGQPDELAANSGRLAWHFQEAGKAEKAIDYRLEAGSRAVQLGASQEGVEHFKQGIGLLSRLDSIELKDRKELELQLALCTPLQALKGYAAPEARQAYLRVRELSSRTGHRLELLPTLYFLRTFHHTLEERRAAMEIAAEILASPEGVSDPCQIPLAHWAYGSELSYQGEFQRARVHLEQAALAFDSQKDGWLIPLYGNDPGIASRARLSWVLWFLGYPDQARQHSQAALAMAKESKHPLVQGFAIGRAGVLFHQLIGEVQSAHDWNTKSRQFSEKEGVALFGPAETILAGWIKAEQGDLEEGIIGIAQGLAAWRVSGAEMHLPHYLGLYAIELLKAGQVERGLGAVDEALSAAMSNNEHYYEAELHRIKGELLLQKGDDTGAEAGFITAIDIARTQAAKSWELRATVSLGRLWQKQDKRDQALGLISGLFRWFEEGFDTADLRAVQILAGELRI